MKNSPGVHARAVLLAPRGGCQGSHTADRRHHRFRQSLRSCRVLRRKSIEILGECRSSWPIGPFAGSGFDFVPSSFFHI